MENVLVDLHRALGADDPERYIRFQQEAKPLEPVAENQLLITGQPTTTAPYQDHDSHIRVHLGILEQDIYSQNPSVVAATMAHIQRHLADQFRVEVQQAGVELPSGSEQLSPEQENQIALQAAQAMDTIAPSSELSMEDMLAQAEQRLKEAELELERRKAASKEQFDYAELAQEDKHHAQDLAQERDETIKSSATSVAIARINLRGRNAKQTNGQSSK